MRKLGKIVLCVAPWIMIIFLCILLLPAVFSSQTLNATDDGLIGFYKLLCSKPAQTYIQATVIILIVLYAAALYHSIRTS